MNARQFFIGVSLLAFSVCTTSAAVAQSSSTAETTYQTRGSSDSIMYTVKRLKRNGNGTLTLSLNIQGTQGKPVRWESIGFNGSRPYRDFKLLDMVNKKRYSMLQDTSGNCLCSELTPEDLNDLAAGKSKDINIKFPLPPADLLNITVELPHAEPIEDVPITN